MKSLKKFKSYIGSVIIFSFMLQVTGPLFAATPLRQASVVAEATPGTQDERNLIVDDNLVACIAAMVHDAAHADVYEQLPEPVKRCYTHISNNAVGLPTNDVMAALPSILRYAFEQAVETTRAVRPDAPDLNDAPIVGPGIGCDLKPVLSLLKLIKNRIGCVSDPVCCDSILGILGDACEKFGPDSNISCKIVEILEEIIETRTILCEKIDNISVTATINVDFSDVFTVLDNICDKIENLEVTATVDFSEVFTVLDNICEKIEDLEVTATVDFSEVFTVLEELQETLDECCEEIKDDILDTQTIICRKFDNLCFPIPLRQEDVVNGELELTEIGNYQFCENIDANLLISNNCISVDMNDRKLFGTVCITGDDVILKDGYIQPEAPVDVADAATPAVSVKDCVVNTRLLNLTITNADSTEVDGNNNGLNGRDGIRNEGIKTFILDCCIQTGAGAPGGEADVEQSTPAGNGGNGGCGINSLKDKAQIGRTIVMTGNGGVGGDTGLVIPGFNNGRDAGNSGAGIKISGDLSCVFETKVFTGNGGNGGNSTGGNGDGGNGGDSGDGICNESESTEMRDCTCRTGSAGSGGNAGNNPTNQAGSGGNSGHAIKTQGTQITRVVLSTGNGGSGGTGRNGGAGGNAGHGLFVNDACETEAREIVVERTGVGGNGGNSTSPAFTAGGAGGNGGDAVNITKDSHHTEVRLSTFSNTGRGGSGGVGGGGGPVGTAGNSGRAVTDLNCDECSLDPACMTTQGPSAIFANFAYGIGDTSIRYLINGKVQEAGRSSDKSCNRLDNVYVECNVDVVFDFCQEIVDTQTILCDKFDQTFTVLDNICDKIENISVSDCDFFITQNSTGESNNVFFSGGTATLSEPGVYCLAEDVSGTISIESDNVTVKFEGHTLTAASPGITSDGFNHIRIESGAITGGTPALDISNGIDIEIVSMNLSGNTKSIQFDNIQDFIIHDCQFTSNSDTGIDLFKTNNGKVTCCQLHDNTNNTTLTLIKTVTCKQLLFDEIVITNNSAGTNDTATLIGIDTFETHESTFKRVQFTCNTSISVLQGITLSNSEDNIISECLVNKNQVTSVSGSVMFVGLEVTATNSDSGHNNMIMDCKINENTSSTTVNADELAILVGINIGGAINGTTVAADACKNNSVRNSTINNNICTTTQLKVDTFFVGINIGGAINSGTVSSGACENCSISNSTINSNSCTGTVGDPKIPDKSEAIFFGINMAGIIVSSGIGIVNEAVCTSCSVRNSTINGNNCEGLASFVGINLNKVVTFGGIAPISPFIGNCCNNCLLDTISISQNVISILGVFLCGINMNGRAGTAKGGCDNITCIMCLIENNTIIGDVGIFNGIYMDGTGNGGLNGGCNNVTLKMCEVHKNTGIQNSDAYTIIGTTAGGLGGARNIQLENCTAKQNTSEFDTCDGFDLLDTENAILLQCMSLAHTTNGFNLKGVTDSCLRECKAIDNSDNGFIFEDSTENVTITESQALANTVDGFEFTASTTLCHIRNNIAQDNSGIGFNNVDGDTGKHQFFGNFAQGNGTNYSGVALVTVPDLTTSSFANVVP